MSCLNLPLLTEINFANIDASGTIENYYSRIARNQRIVEPLYAAYEKATYFRANSKGFFFRFNYPGIGCQTYSGNDLIVLQQEGVDASVNSLFADLNIDNVVRLLFKARPQFGGIYCAIHNFLQEPQVTLNSQFRFISFTNPYRPFVNLDRNTVRVNLCNIAKIFCLSCGLPFQSLFSV